MATNILDWLTAGQAADANLAGSQYAADAAKYAAYMQALAQDRGNILGFQATDRGNILDYLLGSQGNTVDYLSRLAETAGSTDRARLGADANRYGSLTNLLANMYGADTNLAGNQLGAAANIYGSQASAASNTDAARMAQAGELLKQERFNSVAPMLGELLGLNFTKAGGISDDFFASSLPEAPDVLGANLGPQYDPTTKLPGVDSQMGDLINMPDVIPSQQVDMGQMGFDNYTPPSFSTDMVPFSQAMGQPHAQAPTQGRSRAASPAPAGFNARSAPTGQSNIMPPGWENSNPAIGIGQATPQAPAAPTNTIGIGYTGGQQAPSTPQFSTRPTMGGAATPSAPSTPQFTTQSSQPGSQSNIMPPNWESQLPSTTSTPTPASSSTPQTRFPTPSVQSRPNPHSTQSGAPAPAPSGLPNGQSQQQNPAQSQQPLPSGQPSQPKSPIAQSIQDAIGGQAPAGAQAPSITTGGIYTPQQQQQAINQALAGNAATRDAANTAAQQNFGARGFGGNSTALAAMENQNRAAEMMANTRARTDIPMQFAEKNAAHLLASQRAAEDQFAQRMMEDIQRKQVGASYLNPLLSALTGLMG